MSHRDKRAVLDTCMLRDYHFIEWLHNEFDGEICTSSVSYMEYRRQILNKDEDLKRFESMMKTFRVKVLPFDKNSAIISSELMADRPSVYKTCGKMDWADTMIFSSVSNPSTILITENISDFPVTTV